MRDFLDEYDMCGLVSCGCCARRPEGLSWEEGGLCNGAQGMNGPSREHVRKVMLVLTDGTQTTDGDDQTAIAMAEVAKQAGISLFAVGFGSSDVDTIMAMASEPSFAVHDASIDLVREHFADGRMVSSPVAVGAAVCGRATPAATPPPSPDPPPPSPPPSYPPLAPEYEGCERKIDFVLVLDESGSMGSVQHEVKAFAHEITHAFEISEDMAKFAVVTFESDAKLQTYLTSDKTKIANAIDTLQAGGATSISDGLNAAGRALAASNGCDTRASIE